MIHKLIIKLKQHTPLLHFQPLQEGATLRASEVKPRLDKFLFAKSGVNYKLRVKAESSIEIPIPTVETLNRDKTPKRNPINGEQLYHTVNYPKKESTLVLGNIGGREKESVLNLIMFESVSLIFSIPDESVTETIIKGINRFIGSTNFGNRKSKGFGSFSVVSIERDGVTVPLPPVKEDPNYIGLICENRPFSTHNSLTDQDSFRQLFKRIFSDIQEFWGGRNGIKRACRGGGEDDLRNVLLGTVTPEKVKLADSLLLPIKKKEFKRIPSPILFKPLWSMTSSLTNKNCREYHYSIEVYFVPEMLEEIANKCEASIDDVQDYYYGLFDNFML